MKYIIDIPKTVGMLEAVGSVHYTYFDGIQVQTIVLKGDEIEELNSDYVNEHFSDLQDTAYQKGFEDGVTKRTDGDACAGCEYKGKTGEHLPCHYCKNAYTNQWRAKKEEIGAGDVVKTYNGITYVVTKATIDGIVVGFAGDGGTCRFALSEVTYTGRHYNINEILGGLCDD